MKIYTLKNKDGQPLNSRFNQNQNAKKSIDMLCGLSMGILADGVVTEAEVRLLAQQVEKVREFTNEWPIDYLSGKCRKFHDAPVITEDDRESIKEVLLSLVGNDDEGETTSTTLPLCSPAPDLIFKDRKFVITGKFHFGGKKAVEEEILERGGIMGGKNVTLDTNYLVIGTVASRDWRHSSMGGKILRAVEVREKYKSVEIISEEHWENFL